MAETSMLWTTNGTGHGVGSGYASNRWQNFMRKLFLSDKAATACVLAGVDNELAVSGTASPVTVATGAAIGYAFLYENDAPINVAVTTPAVNITGGHIVLRADFAAQTVTVVSVRNTDGVAAIPAVTQSAGVTWEIQLATYTITTGGVIALTDVRKRAKYSGHVYSGNFDSSAVDNVGIELSSGALRLKDLGVTTGKINDLAVTAAKLASDAVTTAKILDANVTTAKINDLAVTTAKIADLNVTLGKLANDSVDDTKAGNRVLQFYRRQGGSATDWSTAGTSTQTPTTVRAQAGVIEWTGASASSGFKAVTFPTAFSQVPIVFCQSTEEASDYFAMPGAITASGFNINWKSISGSLTGGIGLDFAWIAFGAE